MKTGKVKIFIAVDLIRVLEKPSYLFTKCLYNWKIPKAWKEDTHYSAAQEKRPQRPEKLSSDKLALSSIQIRTTFQNIYKNTLDVSQPGKQAGFWEEFSTVDHILTENQITVKTTVQQTTVSGIHWIWKHIWSWWYQQY